MTKESAMPPVRTLFLMMDVEYPPTTGTPQGVWRNLVALAQLGPLAVFSVRYNENGATSLPGVERWHHVEKPERHAIDTRSKFRRILERVLRVFSPPQYPFFYLSLEKRANRELRDLIDEFKPTVAVVDHWLNAVIPSPLLQRDFPVVIASHDVEWQLVRDLTAGKTSFLKRLRGDAEIFHLRRMESRLYRDAARTWAVSEGDRRAIQDFTGLTSEVRTLPAVIELDRYESVRREKFAAAPEARSKAGPTLLYAGGYFWSPNVDAAHSLIEDIYPRVRAAYPGTRLLLVGREPTPHMEAAARADSNIVVTGEVADVRPYLLEADIIPVPLLAGGGMRVKILEAFAAGVPVVSTTKGAEGINVADGRELLVRDGVERFAQGIKELWDDPQRAREIAENGFAFVRREHSMELLCSSVRAEIEELLTARSSKA